MGVVDEVRIDFLGNTEDIDRKKATLRSELRDIAQKPVVVTPDPGPTISYWRNNSEVAKRSLAEIAAEKAANDALDARLLKAQEDRYKATLRQQAAESYAANERILQEHSVTKHNLYILDKEAEEKITGTLETETNKRISRIRGLGPLFRATGLYQYGIDETTLNAGISVFNAATGRNTEGAAKAGAAASAAKAAADTESAAATAVGATAETEKAAAATVAAAAETEAAGAAAAGAAASGLWSVSMATIAPILAVGAVAALAIYNIVRDIRAEENHRLQLIEAENKGINAQLTYEKAITDEFAKRRADADATRQAETYKKDFGQQSTEDLQRRRDELAQLTKYAPTGEFDPKTGAFSALAPQQITERKKNELELLALEEEIYRRRNTPDTSFSSLTEAHDKYIDETRAKFDKEIEEGRKKATEIGKAQGDAFNTLYEKAAADNPFARQMAQNAAAVDKFKETARLLPPELQSVGFALLKQANDLAIYKLQIDATFQTLDLRDSARRFRDPTKQEQQAQLNSEYRRFLQGSNSTNPEALRYFQEKQTEIDQTERRQTQTNLDARLAVDRAARTPAQQAEADARTAAFARGLDPNQLRLDQRRDIADIFERQATRAERRQDEANGLLKRQLETADKIERNTKDLIDRIGVQGTKALNISVTDSTSDKKVDKVTTATPDDVSDFQFTGFDVVGGSNR